MNLRLNEVDMMDTKTELVRSQTKEQDLKIHIISNEQMREFLLKRLVEKERDIYNYQQAFHSNFPFMWTGLDYLELGGLLTASRLGWI